MTHLDDDLAAWAATERMSDSEADDIFTARIVASTRPRRWAA